MLFTCDDTPNGKWSDRERSDSGRTVEINFESEILQVDNPSIITVSTAEKHPQQDSNIESQSDGQTYIDIAKSDNQARTNITNSEIIVPPSTKEMLQVVSSPATLTLAGLYACSFGTELAVNAILGSYYAQNFPSLGQTKSGQMAAMFGLLNVLSRPLSGIISDALYRRTQSVWAKKIWLISVGICGGALLVTIGALNPNREATMFGLVVCLAIFIQAASGANFSLAPHVYPAANGRSFLLTSLTMVLC